MKTLRVLILICSFSSPSVYAGSAYYAMSGVFAVPSDVKKVSITVNGGGGGGGAACFGARVGAPGGPGGTAWGTFSVTPGEILYVSIGWGAFGVCNGGGGGGGGAAEVSGSRIDIWAGGGGGGAGTGGDCGNGYCGGIGGSGNAVISW